MSNYILNSISADVVLSVDGYGFQTVIDDFENPII
jgi:hypothetical protein